MAGPIYTLSAAMELDTSPVYAGVDATIAKLKAGGQAMAGAIMPADQAMAEAGRSMGQLRAAAERLRNEIDPLRAAKLKYAQALKEVHAMEAAEIISAREKAAMLEVVEQKYDEQTAALRINTDALQENAGAQRLNSGLTGQAGAGLQQLAMNVSDMTTMWSLGARGTQIFGSQIGQLVQSVQLLAGGTGKFAAFMANPWVMAVTYATMILGPLAGSLLETEETAAGAKREVQNLSDQFDFATMSATELAKVNELLADANREVERTSIGAANATRIKAEADRDAAKAALIRARSEYERLAAFSRDPAFAEGNLAYAGQLEGLDGKIEDLTAKIDGFDQVANRSRFNVAVLTAGLDENGLAAERLRTRINELRVEYQKTGDNAFLQRALEAQAQLNSLEDRDRPSGASAGQRRIETLARETTAVEAQIEGLLKLADAYMLGDAEAMRAEVAAKARAQGIKKQADVDAYVAQQTRLAVAERLADGAKVVAAMRTETNARASYNDLVAQGVLTAEKAEQLMRDEAVLRPYLTAEALAEGDAKAKLTGIIAELTQEQARANEEERQKRDNAGVANQQQRLEQIEAETKMEVRLGKARIDALKGLNGEALEDALAAINLEREISAIRIQAEAEAQAALNLEHYETAKKIREVAEAQIAQKQTEFDYEQQEVAIERVNQRLADMEQILQDIGGAAGLVGGLLEGLRTGNFSGLGSGPLAQLVSFFANMPFQKDGVDKDGNATKIATTLGKELKDVFGKKGLFGQTLEEHLQAAGVGMASANIILGDQGTAGNIGSAIGGALGEVAGKEFLGFLGNFAGPVGSIVGGLLGGVLGGIFGGPPPPAGTATVTSGSVRISGNDAERKQAAGSMAGAVTDALDQIVDQLGGEVGDYLFSIGAYKDVFRVNYSGGKIHGPIKNAIDDDRETFDNAEDAIKAALQDAIRDGAITGIRAGAQVLLQAEGDIEKQLEKAFKFEGVFDELAEATNPLFSAFQDFKDEFEELREIFVEAKATTEELADLQELQAIRLRELIEQASSSYRSTFWTDEQNVAYAKATISREMGALGYGNVDTVEEYTALVDSIDLTTEAGIELYGALMGLSDEFAVLKNSADNAAAAAEQAAEKEKALATQRATMEIQLLQLRGDEAAALAKQRAMELDALDPSLRDLQRQIYQAQDLAAAKDALSQAYERESGALEETAERWKSMGESLREFRRDLDGDAGGAGNYASLRARLVEVGNKAMLGDIDAAGKLAGAGNDFLDAAREKAANEQEYAAALAMVKRFADGAISAADEGVSEAEAQLAELKASVAAQIEIVEQVETVREVLERIEQLQGDTVRHTQDEPARNRVDTEEREERADRRQRRLEDGIERLRERQDRTAELTNSLLKLFTRLEGEDGLRVQEVT